MKQMWPPRAWDTLQVVGLALMALGTAIIVTAIYTIATSL